MPKSACEIMRTLQVFGSVLTPLNGSAVGQWMHAVVHPISTYRKTVGAHNAASYNNVDSISLFVLQQEVSTISSVICNNKKRSWEGKLQTIKIIFRSDLSCRYLNFNSIDGILFFIDQFPSHIWATSGLKPFSKARRTAISIVLEEGSIRQLC